MPFCGACREEQEVLEAAARQEHKAALAAAAAAARDAKQDLQQMQMAAQRMAWRTRRWQIAHLRRHALEVRPHPAHAFTASCANVYVVRYHLVRHDNGCSSCSVGLEAQFCLNVLWYGLINGNMCQPLLSRQPGRYQLCLTRILKAVQQALFYDWRVCRRAPGCMRPVVVLHLQTSSTSGLLACVLMSCLLVRHAISHKLMCTD